MVKPYRGLTGNSSSREAAIRQAKNEYKDGYLTKEMYRQEIAMIDRHFPGRKLYKRKKKGFRGDQSYQFKEETRREMAAYDPEHVDRAKKYDTKKAAIDRDLKASNKLERDFMAGKISRATYEKRFAELNSPNWKSEAAGRMHKDTSKKSDRKYGKGLTAKDWKKKPTNKKKPISKEGWQSGIKKLMAKGYSKSQATDRMKGLAKSKQRKSSGGMSKSGFRRGMAKLIDKGYSKQQAFDQMSALAKAKKK